MIQTAELDPKLREEAFYETPFYFSYSSLNRLLTAPRIFHKEYVLQEKEIRTEKHLVEGSLVHYLLLDSANFDDKFIVAPEGLPSENSMKVAKVIFKIHEAEVIEDPTKQDLGLGDYEPQIMTLLEEMNLHQKVGEDKRASKIIEQKTEEYFSFLKNKGQKDIIDSGMLDRCARAAEVCKLNEQVRDLLGMDREADGTNFGVYNELPLKMDVEGLPFGLKGVLDNLTVDVPGKTVRINDFKTTNKSVVDFPESVEYWNYWLQAAMYITLAMEYLKQVIKDDWKFETRFIVLDKYDQIYPYPVSNGSVAVWTERFHKVLNEDAKFHYESRDYSLPYQFIAGEVTL